MKRSVLLVLLVACAPEYGDDPCVGEPSVVAVPGPVVLDAPCGDEVLAPTRLLVTTTDFSTGAVSVVDVASMTVSADVALGSTDAIPAHVGDLAVLVHRYQIDDIQLLDPARDWATVADIPITAECTEAPNPQAIVFDGEGRGFVPQLDVPEIAILDGTSRTGTIDMRGVPDEDGNPDLGAAIACGGTIFVNAQRLDDAYQRVGPDELVAVDTEAAAPIDLDAKADGVQGLRSEGAWLRQLRRDPADASGHTVLGLTTGIERFDLANARVQWAVAPERFAAAGIGDMLQPQSFAIGETGALAYVAAYDEGFGQVQLYVVGLDDHEPQVPQSFADDLESVERTLERTGDRLWYGSTRRDAPGLFVFDLTTEMPTQIAGPLSVGLPPYSMVAIP
jgi:hypothetical protein